jgi:hypothetical protein
MQLHQLICKLLFKKLLLQLVNLLCQRMRHAMLRKQGAAAIVDNAQTG